MAERLSSERRNEQPGAAEVAAFLRRYDDLEGELADCQESVRVVRTRRKDLRKEIEASGIPLAAFDRAREDAGEAGATRERRDEWYRRLLAWMKKPVGYQAAMDFDPKTAAAMDAHELHQVDAEGFRAGEQGLQRDKANTYTPGTEAYQRFDTAWLRGQAEIASDMAPAPSPASPVANGSEMPRRRGRPPGSKNKPKAETAAGNGAAEPQPETPALRHEEAFAAGRADGFSDTRMNAGNWLAGEHGHADYELGWAEGKREAEIP